MARIRPLGQRPSAGGQPQRVREEALQEAADTLATALVPVLGFIFNRADPKKVNSHSNYYYYYEDGAPRSSHRANGKKKRI